MGKLKLRIPQSWEDVGSDQARSGLQQGQLVKIAMHKHGNARYLIANWTERGRIIQCLDEDLNVLGDDLAHLNLSSMLLSASNDSYGYWQLEEGKVYD